MRIRKLQIQGFKSFADRVTFNFDGAISGVVGPNGCGKSNVVDAIRWVMGEQSARKLRGAQMQDIIFNGSEGRGPVGMAEVSITFENSDQAVPVEYLDIPEITVTRRLYRAGDSEYLINKQPVRLRDVSDLFLGSGVGTRAYSIVEQDRVALIVNARPEERRKIIEEAAGITKYKSRRASAERKLEATEQNLARVSDVTRELERTVNSLQRQARKAARYRKLRSEIEQIELHEMTMRYFEHIGALKVDRGQVHELTDKVDSHDVDLMRLEADIETARVSLMDDERELSAAQGRVYELESQVQLAEQDISHHEAARERIDTRITETETEKQQLQLELERLRALRLELEGHNRDIVEESGVVERELAEGSSRSELLGQQRETVEAEAEAQRQLLLEHRTHEAEQRSSLEAGLRRRGDLEDEVTRLASERDQLDEVLAAAVQAAEAARGSLAQARAEQQTVGSQVSTARQSLEGLRADAVAAEEALRVINDHRSERSTRLASLQEIDRTHAAAPVGVQQALTLAEELGLTGVGPLVADMLMVPEQLEASVAALLGPTLQAILVDDLQTAAKLSSALREGDAGRARFVPRRDVTPPPAPKIDIPGATRLSDLVQAAPGARELVAHLLGGALLVDDLDIALSLRARGARVPMVTRAGELLATDGALTGGQEEAAVTGALRQRREMRELEYELASLVEQQELAQQNVVIARQRRDVLEAQVEELVNAQQAAALRVVEREQSQRASADEQSRLDAQREGLRAAHHRVRAALRNCGEEIEATRHRLGELSAAASAALLATEANTAEAHRLEEQLDLVLEQLTEIRVRAASTRGRREDNERRLDEAATTLDEARQRLDRLDKAIERDQAEAIRRAAALEESREIVALRSHEASELREALSSDRQDYDQAIERVGEMESLARDTRQQVSQLREELSEVTLRLREGEVSLEHLLADAEKQYQVRLEEALFDFHLLPEPGPEAADRIAQIRRILESLGEVNLAAASEYEESRERFEFLRQQQDDLVHAVGQLRRAISKIDRTTRQRFVEAFNAINEKFQQVFPRLFGGGRAHLQLVEPDEVLTSGIEVFAQPPGKSLRSVTLMSGGEKALTAISLIFSVFLIRPSPFCLLDEVDAWLDDANVGRFVELLRDVSVLSQFLFISHNRQTMEVADRLYGVTMETPGVSKIVSVQLHDEHAPDLAEAAA